MRKAYGDRRMGKAVGYDRDTPRLHEMVHGSDPTRLDNMDPPNHTRIRRLASQAFTPPQIKIMTGWIDRMVTTLFDDLESEGKGADFMELYAWKFPLQVISAIIGGPEDMIPTLRGWVDQLTGQSSSARAALRGLPEHPELRPRPHRRASGERQRRPSLPPGAGA